MSRDTIHEKNPFLTRFSKTATAAAILILLVQPAHAQNHFARFQTYVGTIDIASKGQGLLRAPVDPATGLLTVELNLDDQVPDDADIVAAFGYYVALEKTGAASEVKVLLQDPSSSLYLPPNPNPNDPAESLSADGESSDYGWVFAVPGPGPCQAAREPDGSTVLGRRWQHRRIAGQDHATLLSPGSDPLFQAAS